MSKSLVCTVESDINYITGLLMIGLGIVLVVSLNENNLHCLSTLSNEENHMVSVYNSLF